MKEKYKLDNTEDEEGFEVIMIVRKKGVETGFFVYNEYKKSEFLKKYVEKSKNLINIKLSEI